MKKSIGVALTALVAAIGSVAYMKYDNEPLTTIETLAVTDDEVNLNKVVS